MTAEEILINSSAVSFGFYKQVREDLLQGESPEKLTENHLALDPFCATESFVLSMANILRLVNSKGTSDAPKQSDPQLCKCFCDTSQKTTNWQATSLRPITESITSSQLSCTDWSIYYLAVHWKGENSQLPLLKSFIPFILCVHISSAFMHVNHIHGSEESIGSPGN